MKAGIRLLAGLGITIGICALAAGFDHDEPEIVASVCPPEQTQLRTVMLPAEIVGTDLTAEALSYYEGPYLEDGSYEEVCDVAALVVANPLDTPIRQVQILVETEKEMLQFAGSWIPAGSKCVLLEMERNQYAGEAVYRCTGIQQAADMQNSVPVELREEGDITICVVNRSDSGIPALRLGYKTYLQQTDMYIGGITNELLIENLEPGREYCVTPPHYVKDYCRIVFMRTDE